MPKTKSKNQKPKTKATKSAVQQTTLPVRPRRLKQPKRYWHKPWTWLKRLPPPPYKPLSKARELFGRSINLLAKNWKLFGGIILIYGVLNILLVRGVSGSNDLDNLKSILDSLFNGAGGKVTSAFLSFTYLLSTSGSGNTATSGVYQSFLLLVGSLAFIWALRQTTAKNQVRIRDSFYRGMYPLIPFIIVLLLVGIQLLPLVVGGALYSTVVTGGIAIHAYEKLFWGLLFLVLGLWSLRMITSSIFALYIATLPDMTPLKAIRSAKQLVYGRRLLIWRKLIFLPVMMILVAALVEIPLILFVTPLAVWAFFILSMGALALVHSYLYGLYRELLNE